MQFLLITIFYTGLVSTVMMTLFSYGLSYALQRNFKEPEILGTLIQRLIPALSNTLCLIFGWLLHLAVGYVFVIAYALLWHYTSIHPSGLNGTWIGAISGVVGIGIWHVTLKLHPNPPFINLGAYYLNLLIAHIVFGVSAALTYQ